jgi:hypothetical protein
MTQLFRHVLVSSKFPTNGLSMTILGFIPETLLVFQVYFMKTKQPTNPSPTLLRPMHKLDYMDINNVIMWIVH